ncbi:MAG TPA: hypothetical protein VFQ91_22460 [Bryobacteraceae bacterium]|nr:hypothetical protein [Bryobacteraceae bacterium]
MVHILLYLLLCVIAGMLGRESRLGFWGVAAAGLFFTPVVALLLVLAFGRRGSYV